MRLCVLAFYHTTRLSSRSTSNNFDCNVNCAIHAAPWLTRHRLVCNTVNYRIDFIGYQARARRSIFLEREAGVRGGVRIYEKFRAAGNEVRSQKGRVHVWTATVICSRIHGHLSAHGPACLLLHRQNSIVPLLTTSISRHPLAHNRSHRPFHSRVLRV